MARFTLYSEKEIKKMKTLIKNSDDQGLYTVARQNHEDFGRPFGGFYLKLIALKNSRSYGARKAWRTRKSKASGYSYIESETSLPEGFTFEGTPKKVTFCTDHFRVYF